MANLSTTIVSALNTSASASPLENFGTAGFIITGTWVGTLTFEGSLDGVNFSPLLAESLSNNLLISSTTVNGQFLINTSGLLAVRARMTLYTSGSASVTIQANAGISFQRSLSTLFGATDGTRIGNTGDKLRVESSIAGGSGKSSWSRKLRYDDMNVSNGGIARDTLVGSASWTQIYSYTGSGLFIGFLSALEKFENEGYFIRLVVDNEEVFGASGISTSTIANKDLYMWEKKPFTDQGIPVILGFHVAENGIRWNGPMDTPIQFLTNVRILIRKQTGDPKKFMSGLVTLTKET